MGFAVDPNKTFEYVLVTDRDKPEAERPTFRFRYLSARDCNEVEQLFIDSIAAATNKEGFGVIVQGVKKALVGWSNVKDFDGKPVSYDPEKLEDVLSRADLLEMRASLPEEMTLSESDKKKAAFASLSTSANSAK